MGPNAATAVILVICLVLVLSVYFLGYSTGQTLCAGNGRTSIAGRVPRPPARPKKQRLPPADD